MSNRYSIRMNDIEFYKNNIYFSARELNGLYSVDINGGQAQFIGAFPGEDEGAKDLHSMVIRYESELVFLPDTADNICVYNLDDGNFTNYKYPIDSNMMDLSNGQKVASAILINHEVYIFGGNNPSILIFNFITKKIKICTNWLEKVEEYGLKGRSVYFCEDIAKMENSIFVKLRKSNIIIEYNMRKEQFSIHVIAKREYPVVNCVLASADEKLWMLYTENENKKVIGWNCQGVVKEIDFSERMQGFPLAYEYSAVNGREIWFFPYPLDLPILIFNLDTEEIRTMYLNSINCDLKDGVGECIWFRKVHRDKIFFKTVRGNKLYYLRHNEEPTLCADIFTDRSKLADKMYDTMQILYEYKNDWVSGPCIEDLVGLCLTDHNHTDNDVRSVNDRHGQIIERYIIKEC